MIKLPIIIAILHISVWAILITHLMTSNGCAMDRQVIILKHPESLDTLKKEVAAMRIDQCSTSTQPKEIEEWAGNLLQEVEA